MLHTAPPSVSARFFGACPGCGHPVTCPSPGDLTRLIELTEQEEAVLDLLWRAAQEFRSAKSEEIFTAMYADDPTGGPEPRDMYPASDALLESLSLKARAFGFGYTRRRRRGGITLRLQPCGDRAAPQSFHGKGAGFSQRYRPLPCLSCTRMIDEPSLELIMESRQLQPRERQIVRAIKQCRGRAALNEWLYDAMYKDEPRPDPARMYNALKTAISYARRKLAGSGLTIVNNGYASGYLLVHQTGAGVAS